MQNVLSHWFRRMARSKITSSKFVWVHSWQIRIQSVHKYERTDHSFVADWNDTDQKGTAAPVAFTGARPNSFQVDVSSWRNGGGSKLIDLPVLNAANFAIPLLPKFWAIAKLPSRHVCQFAILRCNVVELWQNVKFHHQSLQNPISAWNCSSTQVVSDNGQVGPPEPTTVWKTDCEP